MLLINVHQESASPLRYQFYSLLQVSYVIINTNLFTNLLIKLPSQSSFLHLPLLLIGFALLHQVIG